MADRYWVGGADTWNATVGTKWALTSGGIGGQAVPTAADDVYFDAGSGAVNIRIGASTCKNLDFSGFTGTLNVASTFTLNCYGSLTMVSMVSAWTGAINFLSTTAETITSNGFTFNNALRFNGVGGTFAFQDALTQDSTKTFTITNGTVQLKSGVTSTVGSFVANNANTKSLQSTTPGSQATISQASGTVTVADLTIRDSNATGGASWTAYADYENIDAGNNDGWNFSLSPPYATYEPPIIIRSFTQPRRF
jgi:hypothetical protein